MDISVDKCGQPPSDATLPPPTTTTPASRPLSGTGPARLRDVGARHDAAVTAAHVSKQIDVRVYEAAAGPQPGQERRTRRAACAAGAVCAAAATAGALTRRGHPDAREKRRRQGSFRDARLPRARAGPRPRCVGADGLLPSRLGRRADARGTVGTDRQQRMR
eukprot:365565-Chlamydomonas_euryale.AAC.8